MDAALHALFGIARAVALEELELQVAGTRLVCESLAGLEEARYFRVEDGELFPCPGGTNSEGADIDAVEILNAKP